MGFIQHCIILLISTFPHVLETQSFGMNIIQVAKEDRRTVECTVELLKKYFRSGDALSGSIVDVTITAAASQIHSNFLKALHYRAVNGWSIVVRQPIKTTMPEALSPQTAMNEKPQCYFLVIDSIDDENMEEVFNIWKTTVNWNPLAQFVVLVSAVEETEEEMTDIMIEVLLLFMNWKIYNVNVIGQTEETNFIYGKTVFPYHPDNNCGNRVITVETLDICDYKGDDDDEENYDEMENDDEDQEKFGDEKAMQDENAFNDNKNKHEYEGKQADMEVEEQKGESGESLTSSGELTEIQSNLERNQMNIIRNEYLTNAQTITQENVKILDTPRRRKELTEPQKDWMQSKINKSYNKDFKKNQGSFIKKQVRKSFSSLRRDRDNTSHSLPLNQDVEILTKSSHSLQKHLPFTDELAENGDPILYIEEMYRALFSDKIPKDLNGCPLSAGYRPGEPYIYNEHSADYDYYGGSQQNDSTYKGESAYEFDSYDDQPDWNEAQPENSDKLRLNGLEYRLIKTIGERLHITVNIKAENTNVYQLFQKLIDGYKLLQPSEVALEAMIANIHDWFVFVFDRSSDIEMIVGGIDEDPTMSQYVSSTVPYYQDDLTWCVAKAQRSYNLFNFMATFEPSAWMLTFCCIVAVSLSIRLSMKVLKFKVNSLKTFFQINLSTLGTIVSQSVNLPPIPTSLKINFGTIFYMSLMFSNVYQSFLVSTLTTPKLSYQISRSEDLYRKRLNVMGSVEHVRHLSKEGEVFRYIREHFQMCYNIEECLQRTAVDSKLAVAASRQHSFYNPRVPRDNIYCFDRNENIYVYSVTMLLPKKFHLLHKINAVIQNIIESGHMQKWARDLDMRRKIVEAFQRVNLEKSKRLTITQVVGPFALNGFLLLFASSVFALECLAHRLVVHYRTRLKIAKYLHRKFL